MVSVHHVFKDQSKSIAELLKKKYSFPTQEKAEEAFLEEFQQGHFIRVATEEGRIVGIISWRPQGAVHNGVAELLRFAVVKDCKDPRSVKETMFDIMMAEADQYYRSNGGRLRKVFSLIHADAKHIKEFFLDKGLQQEAVLRNHFHPGKDELIFSLFVA